MTIRHDGLRVTWMGYATVRIETPDGFVAYLDPGRYGVLSGDWDAPDDRPHPAALDYYGRDGDLVCVTHDHHYDSDAISRVAAEDATVLVFGAVDAGRIDRDETPVEELPYDVRRVGEESHLRVGDADVWTVPAFNDPDGPHAPGGQPTHPQGSGCGYLLSVDGTTMFWPGDSDALPGFDRLEVSLLLANVGGSVVMDRHEAADLAERLDPDLVLPVHYNTIDSLRADSRAFAADVAARGVPVVLDERGDDPRR
jgi:L-ascorbate metabolism protein UlaG (beta-lactamase superfamily)